MAQNEYLVDGADLTTVADAIREKGGTTAPLSFPDGMAAAVRGIPNNPRTPVIVWDQMTDRVQDYLRASAVYTPDDYSKSVIDEYVPGKPGMTEYYWPLGAQVGETTYYNQPPGAYTPVCNKNGDDFAVLKPTGHVRWLRTTARNARDIGGWVCDGGTVKYGKIIRGGIIDA